MLEDFDEQDRQVNRLSLALARVRSSTLHPNPQRTQEQEEKHRDRMFEERRAIQEKEAAARKKVEDGEVIAAECACVWVSVSVGGGPRARARALEREAGQYNIRRSRSRVVAWLSSFAAGAQGAWQRAASGFRLQALGLIRIG